MGLLSRLKSPGLMVRAPVSLAAALAVVAAVTAYARGQAVFGWALGLELVILATIGALTRLYGIPLPGTGFASYTLGVTAYALLDRGRSEEHTSELQSRENLVCRLLLEKKKKKRTKQTFLKKNKNKK